jgi:hypothetical protein
LTRLCPLPDHPAPSQPTRPDPKVQRNPQIKPNRRPHREHPNQSPSTAGTWTTPKQAAFRGEWGCPLNQDTDLVGSWEDLAGEDVFCGFVEEEGLHP